MDAAVVCSLLAGASGAYFVFLPDNGYAEMIAERRVNWAETLKGLGENGQKVYGALMEKDGIMPQSDIVAVTGMSKAGVTRVLDMLESKSFVERKKNGNFLPEAAYMLFPRSDAASPSIIALQFLCV